MDTPAPVQEQHIMETTSITTATVGIVALAATTDGDVNLVVPGLQVPHCV